MKILRFLLCHLLSITILVSCALLFLSRNALKEDFYRLTGKVSQPVISEATDHSPVKDENQKSMPAAEKKAAVTSHSEAAAETPEIVENPVVTVPPAAEPVAVGEPDIIDNEIRVDNTGAAHSASGVEAEPQAKSDDPWDTVLAGVKDDRIVAAEFGSDMQAEADVLDEAEADAVASFPPENYDPESSSSEISEYAVSSVPNEGFPVAIPGSQPTGQAEENTQGSLKSVQVVPDPEYFSDLEKARRLHWDGNITSAQAAFEKLMFQYPAMPEAAADLGNLFLQQGNRESAIWAYQNAIPRYLNLHREQEAISLMRFVSQYDPAIAESLQKKYW